LNVNECYTFLDTVNFYSRNAVTEKYCMLLAAKCNIRYVELSYFLPLLLQEHRRSPPLPSSRSSAHENIFCIHDTAGIDRGCLSSSTENRVLSKSVTNIFTFEKLVTCNSFDTHHLLTYVTCNSVRTCRSTCITTLFTKWTFDTIVVHFLLPYHAFS
jgi:hypothetical protein